MLTYTKELRVNAFDDFIKSEKIVLVRLYDRAQETRKADIDERIRNYFANEYGRVAFGSLDLADAFPKDIWQRKHLGSFSDKGSGYYLASQGKLIAFHSGKPERTVSPTPSTAAENAAKAGHRGWAAFFTILDAMAASVEGMSPETARAIIEHFEGALGQLPSKN